MDGIPEPEDIQRCTICGHIDATRPYGPNRSLVCFNCRMVGVPRV